MGSIFPETTPPNQAFYGHFEANYPAAYIGGPGFRYASAEEEEEEVENEAGYREKLDDDDELRPHNFSVRTHWSAPLLFDGLLALLPSQTLG